MSGCSLLGAGKKKQPQQVYLVAPAQSVAARADGAACGTIQVGAGNAAAGLRGPRMVYMRDPFAVNYFAFARWGDPPSFMLRDQARRFLKDSGGFSGVLTAPVSARTDWQLEIGDVALVQQFAGDSSTVRMAFEGRLFDSDRRSLIGTRYFEIIEPAGGDARSGVEAANRAAQVLLPQLVDFVYELCDRREQ
jgi:cholesterol transport system auxiliary component